jgi:hypothetical protein
MKAYQAGVLAEYAPYTHYTGQLFEKLAALKPKRLAIMHGSSFDGDAARALGDLAAGFKEVFGRQNTQFHSERPSDSERATSTWGEAEDAIDPP